MIYKKKHNLLLRNLLSTMYEEISKSNYQPILRL